MSTHGLDIESRGGAFSFAVALEELEYEARQLLRYANESRELAVASAKATAMPASADLAGSSTELLELGVKMRLVVARYEFAESDAARRLAGRADRAARDAATEAGRRFAQEFPEGGLDLIKLAEALGFRIPSSDAARQTSAGQQEVARQWPTAAALLADENRDLTWLMRTLHLDDLGAELFGGESGVPNLAVRYLGDFLNGMGMTSTPVGEFVRESAGESGAGFPIGPDPRDGIATLLEMAQSLGYLHDAVVRAGKPELQRPPARVSSMSELMQGAEEASGSAAVVVSKVVSLSGSVSWVVQMPGTSSWDVKPTRNSADLTSDLSLMANAPARRGLAVGQAVAVAEAVRQVQAREGGRDTSNDQMVLVGHSLGGITAAALAQQPAFRKEHKRLSVVTAGSPIADFQIPDSVKVTSFEHRGDPVPALDGYANPERTNWQTIRANDLGEQGNIKFGPGAHSGSDYARTIKQVEARGAELPSLQQWRLDHPDLTSPKSTVVSYRFHPQRQVPGE